MEKSGITFGIPSEQAEFIRTHAKFFELYPSLQTTFRTIFRRDFAFTPEDVYDRMHSLDVTDPQRIEFDRIQLAKQISFYLTRSAAEDFYDIVLLAANGKGFGAYKILRGMYEHLVTARYIAANPAKATNFADDFNIQRWNIINRLAAQSPEIVSGKLNKEAMDGIASLASTAQTKRQESICSKCKQPKPQGAWIKLNLFDMAKEVGEGLDDLYTICYVLPTAYHHATALGLQFKLTKETDSISFNSGPSRLETRNALILSHQLDRKSVV